MSAELAVPSDASAFTPTSDIFNTNASGRQSNSPLHSSPSSSPTVSLDCPPGLSYLEFVRQWTDAHVSKWLTDARVGHHAPKFREHDIRGDVILDLDQSALKETGIISVGDRIKVLMAVKALRQRCMRVTTVPTSNTLGIRIAPDSVSSLIKDPSPSRATSRRLDAARPPPLHFAESTTRDFPQLVGSAPGVPASARTPRYGGASATQSTTGTNQTPPQAPSSNSSRIQIPPPLPVPKTQPPPLPRQSSRGGTAQPNLVPPTTYHSGRRTPEPQAPPPFTKEPLPPAPSTASASSPWQGEYGLPTRPNPGNLRGGTFAPEKGSIPFPRSASPLPSVPLRATSSRPLHQKSGSMSQMSKPMNPAPNLSVRPGTSGEIGSASISHPYQTQGQAAVREPIVLPSLHVPNNNVSSGFTLSPIVESAMTAEPPTPAPVNGYSVGRGPFAGRPTTPSHNNAQISLEELRRVCVKFILAGEGVSRVVNVGDCEGGVEVIERALRKMNKSNGSPAVASETDDGGLVVDGWAVYLEGPGSDGPYSPLTETELLAVCHADPSNPSREHGLTLRKFVPPSRKAQKLQHFFGESLPSGGLQTSPTSPSLLEVPSATPKLSLAIPDDDEPVSRDPGSGSPSTASASPSKRSAASKQLARASTISVMSGLGVLPPPPPDVPASPASKSSPSGSFLTNPQKKIRNFFGQRPPSELITSHLPEFFPNTEKKVLERTARNSMLRVSRSIKRDSMMSGAGIRASWASSMRSENGTPRIPRYSTSPSRSSLSSPPRPSSSSKRSSYRPSRLNEEEDIIPRVSVSTDRGHSFDITSDTDDESSAASRPSEDEPATPHVLPPVSFGTESLSDSLLPQLGPFQRSASVNSRRSSRRYSYMSELRSKRDKSDTASMLTVDEIIAEVESRQAASANESTTLGPSEDETTVIEESPQTPKEDGDEDGVKGEEEEPEEEDEEDEEDTEEEEVALNAEEDDVGKAVTSTGGKRAIKWIKGALIGSGSFGSVYLGMDAFHGLLMAVKQVELPTGSSHNEERKKSMLSALEREIELLKELQHPNIVQYLDSSMDERHLNIFLEYVPGGSVVTLLRNYGAFEEALVRNWVKQILTGLQYLHDRDIIHRDIKGANILVDNKGGIKISDFGISKKVEDNLLSSARVHRPSLQGSVFWMAPEVVKQTSYTSKADIWSVGCLVVEMLTGEHPWAKLTQMQAIFKIGSSARPSIPSDISSEAEDFLNKTFELDYKARPSAEELLGHPWLFNAEPSLL